MKIKELCEKNGFDEYLLNQILSYNDIKTKGIFSPEVDDNDVDRIIKIYKTVSERREKSKAAEEKKALAEEEKKKRISSMPVTTGDLHQDYEIIGPVYFQVSNKGLFSSSLSELTEQYRKEIESMKASGTMSENRADWGFLYGEWSVGQNQFESAFYIATQELRKRAALVGGDAIIGMRQDIDLDSNGFSYFYLQMYGTAVKIKEKQD